MHNEFLHNMVDGLFHTEPQDRRKEMPQPRLAGSIPT